MKTLTEKIKIELEGTDYQLLDSGESKRSKYWFLWDSKNGDMPTEIREDDYRVIKLRLSDHDAICGRSMADNQLIESFFNGSFEYSIDLDVDSDWTEEEVKEELSFNFNMSFDSFEVEEIGFGDVKISTKDQDLSFYFVSKYLTRNLK